MAILKIGENYFSTPLKSQYASIEVLSLIQSFPIAFETSSHLVHGGTLSSTELALGVHDGVQPPQVRSSTAFASDGQSISGMEAMIRQLLSEHNAEMKHTIESIIAMQRFQI